MIEEIQNASKVLWNYIVQHELEFMQNVWEIYINMLYLVSLQIIYFDFQP